MDGSLGGSDYRFGTLGVKGQDEVSIVLHKPMGGAAALGAVRGLLSHTDNSKKEVERLKSLGGEDNS